MRDALKRRGILLTAGYLLVIVAWVFLGSGENGKSRWEEFTGLALNNIGDFLAGVFSPLAFLWLVLGFFQQGEELQASRKALHLQAEELRQSVEQQRQMVEVAREEHAANLKALQIQQDQIDAQRVAAAEAARPRFILSHGGGLASGDKAIWDVTVTNTGQECTSVMFSLQTDASFVSLRGADRTPHMPRGSIFNLKVASEPVGDWTGMLTISFVNVHGSEGEATFVLRGKERHLTLPL